MSKQYSIAIVGATGAVGQELIGLLAARKFPVSELRPLASARSAGKQVAFGSEMLTIAETSLEAMHGADIVIFAASSDISLELAKPAAAQGSLVIDCSSAYRMDADVPLIIPEINGDVFPTHQGLIANPNCTGAVSMMGLYPLHRAFGLERVIAASYQAVSGGGAPAMAELEAQTRAWAGGETLAPQAFPHPICFNLIPRIDTVRDNGYTGEELKMANEMRKIMRLSELRVSATCVRVPVFRAHSIALTCEFEQPVDLAAARDAIADFPGVELRDDPAQDIYPMPADYSGKEVCGVGRLRRDTAFDNGLSLWAVGDQLWKGAALNAVQIAELAIRQ